MFQVIFERPRDGFHIGRKIITHKPEFVEHLFVTIKNKFFAMKNDEMLLE